VVVTLRGQSSCVFDGATTAGDYVVASTITAGDCHDNGAAYPTGIQAIGRVLSTNAAAGTYTVELFGPEHNTGTITTQSVDSFFSGRTALAITTTTSNLTDGTTITKFTTGTYPGAILVSVAIGQVTNANGTSEVNYPFRLSLATTGSTTCTSNIIEFTIGNNHDNIATNPVSASFVCTKTGTSADTITAQVATTTTGELTIPLSSSTTIPAVHATMIQIP
jgi:hypothetical protein